MAGKRTLLLVAAAVVAVAAGGGCGFQPQAAGFTAAVSSSEALGNSMAAAYGWGPGQQGCLDALWTRESGWRADAVNPTSGATGIPQLNPHFYAIPPGWADPRVQIRWGLRYLRNTPYGTHDPCGAWAHEQNKGWY